MAFIVQRSGLEGGGSQEVGQEDVSSASEKNLNSQREGKRSEAPLESYWSGQGARAEGGATGRQGPERTPRWDPPTHQDESGGQGATGRPGQCWLPHSAQGRTWLPAHASLAAVPPPFFAWVLSSHPDLQLGPAHPCAHVRPFSNKAPKQLIHPSNWSNTIRLSFVSKHTLTRVVAKFHQHEANITSHTAFLLLVLTVTDPAALTAVTITVRFCRRAAFTLAGISLLCCNSVERLKCEGPWGCLETAGSVADSGSCSAPSENEHLKKQFVKLCLKDLALRHDWVHKLRPSRRYRNANRTKWEFNSRSVI